MSEHEIKQRQDYKRTRKRWILVQTIAVIIAFVLALLSFLTYDRMNRTYYIEYTEGGSIDYKVQYKANDYFGEEWIGSGQSYVTSLINMISADFKYKLDMGESDVGFDYTYDVVAQLIVADKLTGDHIYDPTEVIVPEISGKVASSGHLSVTQNVPIDFNKFNDTANSFVEIYDLKSTTMTLVVTMKVNVISSCSEFEESNANTYTTSLNIPLGDDNFSMHTTSSGVEGETKVLACKGAANQDVFLVGGFVSGGAGFVFLLILIVFIFVTRNDDVTYSSRVERIVRAYSSYIQGIEGEFDTDGYQVIVIKTFNEMLGIRDTIQSPILMSENRDQTKTQFLIPTNTKLLYAFEIKVDNYDEIYARIEREKSEESDWNVVVEDSGDDTDLPVAEEACETVTDTPVAEEDTAEEPVEEATEEPASEEAEPAEEATEEVTEEPAEEAVEEATEEAVEEPAVEEAEPVAEEPVEEATEEPAVEEAEPVVEEPAEEATEEPVAEEAEPVVEESEEEPIEEATEEETTEEATEEEELPEESIVADEETIVIVDLPKEEPICEPVAEDIGAVITASDDEAVRLINGEIVHIRYRKSYKARLIQSGGELQQYYTHVKNFLMSYKGIKSRESFKCETFNKGRVPCAKMNVRGSTLMVYLALDPKEYAETSYRFTDMSEQPKYADVPMLIKVKSVRSMKMTLKLIAEMMEKLGLKQGEIPDTEYYMPYESTEALADRGLVRIIYPKGIVIDENTVIEKIDIATLLAAMRAAAPDEVITIEDIVEEALHEPDVVLEEIDYVDEVDEEFVETAEHPGVEVIGVVWPERSRRNKIYRYDPNGETVHDGDVVLVPTRDAAKGRDVIRKAAVAHGNHMIDPETHPHALKKIIAIIKRRHED